MELFVGELESIGASSAWKANAARYLDVCKAHASAYAIHHHRLVKTFLETPARRQPTAHGAGVTSSGPPLDQVIEMLQRLLDLRAARSRPGLASAAAATDRIREALR